MLTVLGISDVLALASEFFEQLRWACVAYLIYSAKMIEIGKISVSLAPSGTIFHTARNEM